MPRAEAKVTTTVRLDPAVFKSATEAARTKKISFSLATEMGLKLFLKQDGKDGKAA